jgi:hypothetical protein
MDAILNHLQVYVHVKAGCWFEWRKTLITNPAWPRIADERGLGPPDHGWRKDATHRTPDEVLGSAPRYRRYGKHVSKQPQIQIGVAYFERTPRICRIEPVEVGLPDASREGTVGCRAHGVRGGSGGRQKRPPLAKVEASFEIGVQPIGESLFWPSA